MKLSVHNKCLGRIMQKERKSEYFHFRLTPNMKQKIMERSLQLKKDPSEYLLSLIEKDLSSEDMNDTEKPRMKEFAQLIANEFFSNINSTLDKSIISLSKKSQHQTSIMLWMYRLILYSFYNIGQRAKIIGNLKSDDLKMIDEESSKNVNSSFNDILDFALSKDADTIIDYLKKPI